MPIEELNTKEKEKEKIDPNKILELLTCDFDEDGNVIEKSSENLDEDYSFYDNQNLNQYDQDDGQDDSYDYEEEQKKEEQENKIEELKTKIILREIEEEDLFLELDKCEQEMKKNNRKIEEEKTILEKNRKIKEELSLKNNLTSKEMSMVQNAMSVIFDKEDLIEKLQKEQKNKEEDRRRLTEEMTSKEDLIDLYKLNLKEVISDGK